MNTPVATDYADEYVHWTERVRATYEAITYTCHHRLGDYGLAQRVAVQVVAGLVARPGVFRYFGLPYSGRIAKLAEARIAEAQQGRLAAVGDWDELRDSLGEVSVAHQEVFVLTCVRGCDDDEIAATLGCDPAAAAGRRDATIALMRHIATSHLSTTAEAGMRS